MKTFKWINQIRGMAIVAVVVCHQQYILHTSEFVQLLSLYSVTLLIFCAGLTAMLSYKKIHKRFFENTNMTISTYLFNKIKSTMFAYILASAAYLTLDGTWTGSEWDILFTSILTFSASSPFYFIKYYITLTCISPVIYFIITTILKNDHNKKLQLLELLFFLVFTFLIGYASIGKFDSMGQSYLFVYSTGMVFMSFDYKKPKTSYIFFGFGVLAIGFLSMKQFYWARAFEHNYAYKQGIDLFFHKLQLNPPNISIILYSIGCFLILYWYFNQYDDTSIPKKIFHIPLNLLALIGTYSLDIFLWHLFIQKLLIQYNGNLIQNIWVKRVLFYGAMLIIPIVCRMGYKKMKNSIYKTLYSIIP